MHVVRQRVHRDIAGYTACPDGGDFQVKRYPLFRDQRSSSERTPRVVDVAGSAQNVLPLAVVAQPARLQHQR